MFSQPIPINDEVPLKTIVQDPLSSKPISTHANEPQDLPSGRTTFPSSFERILWISMIQIMILFVH